MRRRVRPRNRRAVVLPRRTAAVLSIGGHQTVRFDLRRGTHALLRGAVPGGHPGAGLTVRRRLAPGGDDRWRVIPQRDGADGQEI